MREMMMKKEIDNLLELINNDYERWTTASFRANNYSEDRLVETIANFREECTVTEGSKYIKIIKRNAVWGFIVKTDTDKLFAKGDILMAAGYNAPARNKPRGNVFKMLEDGIGVGWVQWTGPGYL
jgi:hypothetical protein|tara:strand:+ start:366 stop:740 length:375 start_codon:yes stop_codon:yes gene_type:complete